MPLKDKEAYKAYQREYARKRYATDPTWRSKVLKRGRDRQAALPKSSNRLTSFYGIKLEADQKCLYCLNLSWHLALCQKHYNRWYQGVQMEPPPQNRLFNREELAWAAGFFDGEGSTSKSTHQTVNGNTRYYAKIQLGQVDRRNLERFHKSIGGIGKIRGPVKTPTKPRYDWSAGGFEDVQAVIALLWCWLSPAKRDQAKGVLLLANTRTV